MLCGHIGLKCTHYRNANGNYLVSGPLGGVDFGCCLLGDNHPLAVHPVFGKVFHIHCTEVAYSHMNGNEGGVDILHAVA